MSATPTTESTAAPIARSGVPGPLRAVLDLFSSVKLGITLLVILFIYMSIGSAGILYPIHPNLFHPDAWVHAQMRQWRPFEMTEFEWFHWWPFDALMILLAANIITTTIRRIRFSVVNLGVWMIHFGVIVLIVGSFIYFTRKVEGDAPIARRAIEVRLLDENGAVGATSVITAFPGNTTSVRAGGETYEITVQSIDPEWELLSGFDAGKRAYSVNLMVNGPRETFIRQLIAGHPEYTEDLVFTEGSGQPFQRAIKARGTATIDDRLDVRLEYDPQEWFYLSNHLAKNWALYVRPVGAREWTMRPIDGLPMYNDSIADPASVLLNPGQPTPEPRPLAVTVSPAPTGDPAPETTFVVDSFLRYALLRTRWMPSPTSSQPGTTGAAMARLEIASGDGQRSEYTLALDDPERSTADGGLVAFRRASDEASFEALRQPPSLRVEIPALGISFTEPVAALVAPEPEGEAAGLGAAPGFYEIGETGYRLRVTATRDDLALSGSTVSVAFVDIETPSGTYRRWVFDDPILTRDVSDDAMGDLHTAATIADDSIRIEYQPGYRASLFTLVAGPGRGDVRVLESIGGGEARVQPIGPGMSVQLPAGLRARLIEYIPDAVERRAPFVVPMAQRNKDARDFFSHVRVQLPGGGHAWLRYHSYAFREPSERLRRHIYEPTRVRLADGREFEMLFSRRRMPLPDPVVLDRFELATHIGTRTMDGGFVNEAGAIRNYTSVVRFSEDGAENASSWGDEQVVRVNEPGRHDDFWFFQAQWDPPEPARFEGDVASNGLNYTVLGVGNRHGVYTQLAGCCIAVIGMIYAFYVKPVIKRRRRLAVYQAARESHVTGERAAVPAEETSA